MKNHIATLVHHAYWANHRVCNMLLSLDSIPEKAHRTFEHIIAADHLWYSRVKGESPRMNVWDNHLLVDQFSILILENHNHWMKLLERENVLAENVSYKNTSGKEYSNTVEEIIIHLCLHSQYHRGQVITLCRDLVETPPATDMIVFLRQ